MENLTKIEIKRYRGLRDIELDNLSRINVLVGENNSGKTSVLEAIQLMSEPFSRIAIRSVANQRREFSPVTSALPFEHMLRWLFPLENGVHGEIELEMHLDSEQIPVTFSLQEEEFINEEQIGEGEQATTVDVRYLEQTVTIKDGTKEEKFLFGGISSESKKNKESFYEAVYVSASAHRLAPIPAHTIGKIILDDQEEELVNFLQQFDSEITDIKVIPFPILNREVNTLYIQRNKTELIPLISFGDGLQKVLFIITAILRAKGGVLLLDEVEVGIHTKMIPVFFDWLSRVAKENNVTVFMTTHSLEAVDGVLAANEESLDDLSFYRLEANNVKRFSGERMHSIRYNFGMEVRG